MMNFYQLANLIKMLWLQILHQKLSTCFATHQEQLEIQRLQWFLTKISLLFFII